MKFDLKSSPRHIQRLTNIASVISGISGLNVVIDNKVRTPYFNSEKNVCVLPNGDYSDEKFVKLIEGFICHEAGHGRYTEHEVYREAFVGELINADGFISIDDKLNAEFQTLKQKKIAYARAYRLHGLINLFDDVQMEEKTGIDYQEAKKRLAVSYALMVEAGRMTVDVSSSPQNPVQFIEMFLLNTLRVNVLQQEGHKETLDPFFDYAKKILEPVTLEVDEIIHQALSCKSTQNCDSLARKTLALLERLRDEAKEKQQEEDQNKDPQNDTDNSSGSENEPDSETNGDNQGEGDGDSEEQDDDAGNGKAPMEDNEPSGQSKGDEESAESGNGEPDGEPETDESANPDSYDADGTPSQIDSSNGNPSDGESNFSPEQWSILAKLLDDFLNSDEESEDFHEALANEISVIAASVSDEVKAEFGANEWDVPDLLIDLNVYNEALNISQTLGADLSVLQQVKMRGQFKTRDRGLSFDINRLIQSPMGVRDVFRSQSESKNRGHVGLVIVRDISGSMILDHRYIHAIKTDLALTLAIEANSKMHVANVIYPFVDKDLEVIKTFDENAEETLSKFSLGCKGNNTPTGSALMAAVELLLESQFDRKIVFLITDGYPTESDYTISDVLTVAESNGIEIAGVGIKTDELIGFDEGTFVNVDDISLLPNVVSKLVHQILSN
ncbi:vWA domain-containing protein [Citrobacter sp. RHBSTW-00271]|uniref:vWA domain-containing protein n=1 Tax=Citrobacter sp. RHBSTW-00271 TaxID=2742642 RepID=UPI0015FDA045|nr:VWA domain-containing protein [Citrobacter sp. RHBSTW-00271]EFE7263559.1 VWA domain-containing protein [Escherichia coli]EFG1538749.1 VWA domain-containing protein [Escherichia coli]EIH5472820.1 VWA domain-containing protein [Escherichia coli]MBA7945380.1 VWA domain-containing protein [Citrobacter sp. RHBSTW-00271]